MTDKKYCIDKMTINRMILAEINEYHDMVIKITRKIIIFLLLVLLN